MCSKSFKAGRGRAGRSVSRNDRLVEAQVKTSCAFCPEAENNDMHKSADCPKDITERAVALGINKQCPRRETAGEHLVVGRVSVVELSCAGAHIVSPIRLTQMFFGSLVSGGVFVVSLGALMTVGWIASDINDMYEQAEQQVDEFKIIYDLAWKRVMHKDSVGPTADFATLIGRNKRNAQCNCGAKSKGCPDGPPGPPGEPGKDGEDGKDGEPGKAGIGGMAAAMGESEKKECIVCPAGPPGPPGEDGPQGPPGDDGTPGENGEAGNAGPDGEQGPPGADGRPGAPGKPGPMGHPGHPGIVYAPGRPGRPGMPGARGPPGPGGEDGKDGQDGQPGEQGPAGTPGKDGEQGGDGQPGAPGPDGEPGADAGYCSCPARSQAMRYFD